MDTTKTPAVHPLLEGTSDGPWMVRGGTEVYTGHGSYFIASTKANGPVPQAVQRTDEANAKLIAASPTLAAENARMRAALEEIDKFSDCPMSRGIAREVLASLNT